MALFWRAPSMALRRRSSTSMALRGGSPPFLTLSKAALWPAGAFDGCFTPSYRDATEVSRSRADLTIPSMSQPVALSIAFTAPLIKPFAVVAAVSIALRIGGGSRALSSSRFGSLRSVGSTVHRPDT